MKKIIIAVLVLLLAGSASVGVLGVLTNDAGASDPSTGETGPLDVFAAAESDKEPTKIVTLATYQGTDLFGQAITLGGSFTQKANGANSILDFEYQRFATVEENADDYILTAIGAIAIKDGKTKTVGAGASDWAAYIPELQKLGAITIAKDKLPGYKLSSDGKKLTVSLDKAEALAAIGVVIDIKDGTKVALEITTNGKNISAVSIGYTTASNARVQISTSYTYGAETLDFTRFD